MLFIFHVSVLSIVMSLFSVFNFIQDKQREVNAVEVSGNEKVIELSHPKQKRVGTWKKKHTASTNRISSIKFEEYDLSSFCLGSFDLGYIDTVLQRMYITFEKVRRITTTEFYLCRFCQVNFSACRFEGTFRNIIYNQHLKNEDNLCDYYNEDALREDKINR